MKKCRFSVLFVASAVTTPLSVIAEPIDVVLDIRDTGGSAIVGANVDAYLPNHDVAAIPGIASGVSSAFLVGATCTTDTRGRCRMRISGEKISSVVHALNAQEAYMQNLHAHHGGHHGAHSAETQHHYKDSHLAAHDAVPLDSVEVAVSTAENAVIGKLIVMAEGYLTTEVMDVNYSSNVYQAVTLERGGFLQGYVQDASGKRYSDIRVLVDKEPEGESHEFQLFVPPDPVITDEEGYFEWRYLPSGMYAVRAEVMSKYKKHVVARDEPNFVKIKENEFSNSVLQLNRLSRLQGEIVFSGDVPEYADVSVLDVGPAGGVIASARVETDPLNATPFVVEGLPLGKYALQVAANDYPVAELAEIFTVEKHNDTLKAGAVVMSLGVDVTGVAMDKNTGSAISNASVNMYISGSSRSRIISDNTNVDGAFVLKNIRPGTYEVVLESPNYIRLSRHIRVVNNANYLEFFLYKGTTLEGVWDKPGELNYSKGIEILLLDDNYQIVARDVVNENNQFSFRNIPEGRFSIYIPMTDKSFPVTVVSGMSIQKITI